MSFILPKAQLGKKKDEHPPRDKAGGGGDRERRGVWLVQADRRIALFGSTMYVVMPKRHARPSSTIVPVREEDSVSLERKENARCQFRRRETATFPAVLSLSLSLPLPTY